MKTRNSYLVPLVFLLMCSIAWAQSGGNFTITKSVTGGGGGNSAGGSFEVDGTIGQSVSGTTSTGGTFEVSGGFWGGAAAPVNSVTISGRVTTPSGISLRNAVVSLIDPQGIRRTATTSSFGIYSFDMVRTGLNYTITVASKRYRFAPQFVLIQGTLTNIDFMGLE